MLFIKYFFLIDLSHGDKSVKRDIFCEGFENHIYPFCINLSIDCDLPL